MPNITLTEDQQLRIKQALTRTSFGGLLPGVLTGESLVHHLEENANYMQRVGTKYDEMENDLRRIKADLAATGRIFALMQPKPEA